MKTYVMLLRGVMPTGKNRVPMGDLRTALTEAGLVDVQTYIQSGNVIAKSAMTTAATGQLVHDVIARRLGAEITVITRTPRQLADVLAANPFAEVEASRLYFALLASKPAPELLKKVLETDFGPDRFKVVGETIYGAYATRYSDTKFNNNFFERKLMLAATTRNFNTMTRLVELALAYRDD